MKVCTILGTRPELIRLSRVIPLLDDCCDHVLVHTGQNAHPGLAAAFFAELGIRAPDYRLTMDGRHWGDRVGGMLGDVYDLLRSEGPDRVLILGDTHSGLAALAAQHMGIPVYHLEAGNRCGDRRSPEEANRRTVDHASTVLLPYTERSRANLLREAIEPARVQVVGNPIGEVITAKAARIDGSDMLDRLRLPDREFFLATIHRAETVDDAAAFGSVVEALIQLQEQYAVPVVLPLHPRAADRAETFGIPVGQLRTTEPLGFADFVRLERAAACIVTDSGTVQEEACILGRPCVVARETTERPETVECGATIVAGRETGRLVAAASVALSMGGWKPPPEYLRTNVAATVAGIVAC